MQGINLGTEKEQELGYHQMYSFVVDGKEIKRFDVEFMLQDANLTDEEKTFTTLKARYFTESGKKIEKDMELGCKRFVDCFVGHHCSKCCLLSCFVNQILR